MHYNRFYVCPHPHFMRPPSHAQPTQAPLCGDRHTFPFFRPLCSAAPRLPPRGKSIGSLEKYAKSEFPIIVGFQFLLFIDLIRQLLISMDASAGDPIASYAQRQADAPAQRPAEGSPAAGPWRVARPSYAHYIYTFVDT